MRLNLRQVEAFRAVFQTNSMTAAADLMGVTQPAISRLIRDLEAEIELRLFERSRGGLLATPEAVALYREVQRSFLGLERIAQAAAALRLKRTGILDIAASGGPALHCLPAVIRQFSDAWREVRLTLNVLQSADVRDSVARRQYDLGIADVPDGAPGVETEALPPLDFVCALPADHPLARKKVINPADLTCIPLLMVSHASHQHRRIMSALSDVASELDILLESSNSGPLYALVSQGLGAAILDPITASSHEDGTVAIRKFEPAISYDLKLIFPARQPRSERAVAFADLIIQNLQKLSVRRDQTPQALL